MQSSAEIKSSQVLALVAGPYVFKFTAAVSLANGALRKHSFSVLIFVIASLHVQKIIAARENSPALYTVTRPVVVKSPNGA